MFEVKPPAQILGEIRAEESAEKTFFLAANTF